MTQEDKVVDGDDSGNAGRRKAFRQFSRQTVVQFHPIAPEILHHTFHAPPVALQTETQVAGIAEPHILPGLHLAAEVVAPGIRSVEPQGGIRHERCQVVDQRTPIAAQSCSVSYDPFGIIAYCLLVHGRSSFRLVHSP